MPNYHRKSLRLPFHDYAGGGFYFITLCIEQRACLLGEIRESQVILNNIGEIIEEEWNKTPALRAEISLDAYVIMPNHFHAIVALNSSRQTNAFVGAHGSAPLSGRHPFRKAKSLSTLIAGFKGITSKHINSLRETPGAKVWQRNFHERVIRNEAELEKIRDYIMKNPANWNTDEENPTYLKQPT